MAMLIHYLEALNKETKVSKVIEWLKKRKDNIASNKDVENIIDMVKYGSLTDVAAINRIKLIYGENEAFLEGKDINKPKDIKTLIKELEKSFNRDNRLRETSTWPNDCGNWLKKYPGISTVMIHNKGIISFGDGEYEEIVIISAKLDGHTIFVACNGEMNLFDVDTKEMKPRDYK